YNTNPVLSWTGETNFENDGINPEVGRSSTVFTYRIKYTDPDNDPPASGYPKLHIKKGGVELPFSQIVMVRDIFVGDNRYDNGEIYVYNTNVILSSGTDYTYYFEAKDIYGAIATGTPTTPVDAPDVFNNAPILSWTGETNYVSDGLNPDSGRPSTYTFQVKYIDIDNDPPASGYPKLHIKKGGIEISGSPFTMTYVSGNYSTGANYTYSIKLATGTDYTYYFEAKDKFDLYAVGVATSVVDAPDVINNAPVLSWTGETNYITDGLHPEVGKSTTPFVYRIKYTDIDNDPPAEGYPKLRIKKAGNEIPQSPITMSYVSGSYSTGAIYVSTITLFAGTDYIYFFEAKDEYDAFAVGVSTAIIDAPDIAGSPPTLTWTGETEYENDGIWPNSGTINTQFLFRVKYTDIDNDPPATGYPKLYVKKGNVNISGSPFTMTQAIGWDYATGIIYAYHLTLSTGTNYIYYFEAKDINDNIATGNATSYMDAPDVFMSSYWVGQTVDTQGDVGRCVCIDVDSNNYPHIAYVDSTNSNVKYAKWTGSSWSTYTIVVGNKSSMDVLNNSNIYISYYNNQTLKCAKWDGSSWSSEDVLSNAIGYCTSIAVGSNNVPHIIYGCYDYMVDMDYVLKYAKKTESSWNVSTVDKNIQYNEKSISIALDSNNYPHIVYFAGDDFKYAKWTGLSWSTYTIDTQVVEFGYCFCSISIKNDIPHIAYYDSKNKSLKYAKWTGSSWSITPLVTNMVERYELCPSIAIDSNNNPYIVYYNKPSVSICYFMWTGSMWLTDNIPVAYGNFSHTSVIIDSSGKRHISCYDTTNGDLKYMRFEP
ncbi:MAG: hypothetical protein N2Z73_03230, partial [Endomicrobia bacterium]|nr:hypothetical protein [Endomicrobiia bacterium]